MEQSRPLCNPVHQSDGYSILFNPARVQTGNLKEFTLHSHWLQSIFLSPLNSSRRQNLEDMFSVKFFLQFCLNLNILFVGKMKLLSNHFCNNEKSFHFNYGYLLCSLNTIRKLLMDLDDSSPISVTVTFFCLFFTYKSGMRLWWVIYVYCLCLYA